MYRRAIIDGKTFDFRPGSDEQFVFKEVLVDWCYDINWQPEDVVLNIGGHVGSFDIYVFDKVKEVITYEPSEANYERILHHLKENNITNVTVKPKAVARQSGVIEFTIKNLSGHNTTLPNHEGEKVEVEADGIEEILTQHPITKIKCDCEGGEIEIFKDITLPQSVNAIIMETHEFMTGEQSVIDLINHLSSQGFECRLIKNDEYNRTHLLYCLKY